MKINRLITFFALLLLLGACTEDDLDNKFQESEDMTTFFLVTQDSKDLDVVIKTKETDQEIYWEENGERRTEVIPKDGVLKLPSNTNLRILNNVVEEFHCSSQSLVGFNLDSLLTLKVLDISNSRVNDLRINNSANLEKLNCSNTPVLSLDLSDNTFLTELDCSNTSINELDIAKNTKLTKLNVSATAIKILDLSKNTNLVNFIAQNTSIKELVFTKNSNVENIDIENNSALTLVNLTGLEKLKTIACSNLGEIEKIIYSVENLTNVPAIITENEVIQGYCSLDGACKLCLNATSYYFEDNIWKNVRDIPSMMKIENLRYYGRPITLISMVDNKVVDNEEVETLLPANKEVTLYIPGDGYITVDNSKVLTKIEYYGNDVDEMDVSNCFELDTLDVSDTKIKSIDLSNCTKLKYFSCSLCYGIEEIDLSKCPELVVANCGQTSISIIDLSNNTMLEEFSCSNTDISILDLSANSNLKELRIGRSKITNIDISMLTNLEYLNAERLELTNLDVSACNNLKELFLPYTSVTSIDLSNCTALKELYCENTKLTALDLSNLPNLTKVYCGSNELLETVNVAGSTALKELNCSYTIISSLSLTDNTGLTSINVGNCISLTSIDLSANVNLTNLYVESTALTSLDVSSCPLMSYITLSYSQIEELNLSNTTESLYIGCYELSNINKIIYEAASIDEVPNKIKDKTIFQNSCVETKTCRLYISDTKNFYYKENTGKHPEYGYPIGTWTEVGQ